GVMPMREHGMSEYKRIVNRSRGRDRPRPTDPAERRELFEEYAAVFREPFPTSLDVQDRFIPASGREIPIRLYRHRDQPTGIARPTILYLHGGGYIMGSLDTHATIVANLAVGTGAQIVSVHYRRAPENPYPAALEDA